jgi:hypothetical protein
MGKSSPKSPEKPSTPSKAKKKDKKSPKKTKEVEDFNTVDIPALTVSEEKVDVEEAAQSALDRLSVARHSVMGGGVMVRVLTEADFLAIERYLVKIINA